MELENKFKLLAVIAVVEAVLIAVLCAALYFHQGAASKPAGELSYSFTSISVGFASWIHGFNVEGHEVAVVYSCTTGHPAQLSLYVDGELVKSSEVRPPRPLSGSLLPIFYTYNEIELKKLGVKKYQLVVTIYEVKSSQGVRKFRDLKNVSERIVEWSASFAVGD